MKEFPHLVEMHRKYGKDGLVCVSVSLDEKDNKDRALAFLKKRQAEFSNYLLDEEAEVWQNKLKLTGPPAVLVYGRDGKRARQFEDNDPDHPFGYENVEPVVRKLLSGSR
jgi:hypothetical protein